MPGEIILTDEEIMVLIQLPELTVYHIEVLVGEKVHHLVNVLLLLQVVQCLKVTGVRGQGRSGSKGQVHLMSFDLSKSVINSYFFYILLNLFNYRYMLTYFQEITFPKLLDCYSA